MTLEEKKEFLIKDIKETYEGNPEKIEMLIGKLNEKSEKEINYIFYLISLAQSIEKGD